MCVRDLIPPIILCASLLSLSGWETASALQRPAAVERHLACMGTSLDLWLSAADRPAALAASERAVRALEAAQARLSTWTETSELASLNRAQVGIAHPLGPQLARELGRAVELWRSTGGCFDPGVGALVRAWGLRSGGRRPLPHELEAARSAGGLALLELDAGSARRLHPDLILEEGGFGKGAGLDAALHALEGTGVIEARLNLGGQWALYGTPRVALTLAIAHPDRRSETVLELTLKSGSVATSGNSERAIQVDGERLGHLLDPRTGHPSPDFGSVTVTARDAFTADALSTALFVMGPAAALDWAEDHESVEVIVLERDGDRLRASGSSGLRDCLHVLCPEVDLTFRERSTGQRATLDSPGTGSAPWEPGARDPGSARLPAPSPSGASSSSGSRDEAGVS